MDQKIKILVSGDVRGKFKQLFKRVESVNKKTGPFDILLCVGEFFGENNEELIAYQNNCKNVPVPTFILGPSSESTTKFYENIQNTEICTNLTYLGNRGLYTLSSGLKIAYLSGVESETNKIESWNFKKEDIITIRNSCLASSKGLSDYKGVDILITSQCPKGIPHLEPNGSKLISFLVKGIKPRYHFCGLSNIYYEPPLYRNSQDQYTQLELSTRLISLADVGNENGEKYIYALSINPVDRMRVMDLIQKTTNEINFPYDHLDFSDLIEKQQNFQASDQFFYDLGSKNQRNDKRGAMKNSGKYEKKYKTDFDQDKCWFCLSSTNVEKHLVISIGEKFYLALAKGPINDYHCLLLPITHIQSSSLLPNTEWNELEMFKKALRNFFNKSGQVVCFVERNYRSSHMQINVIAVDSGFEWKIKHSFEDKAEEHNFTFESLSKISFAGDLPQGPYILAELPDGTVLLNRQMKNFSLNFVREVFCSENLLNCDEKIDWRECNLAKEEEIVLVKKFRDEFKEFDFTLT